MKDNNALVFIKNDTPLTTSRTVAEQFEATILLQLDQLNRLLGGHCTLLNSGISA